MNLEQELQDGLLRISDDPDGFVLQIGAGDGLHGDFLHSWLKNSLCKALLLEPVAHVYKSLCQNYSHKLNIQCERFAISNRDATHELYRIGDMQGLPWWADQLATFSRNVILSHRSQIPDIDERIITETVECLTMRTLVQRFSIRKISLLAVDTEGFDANVIIQTINCGLLPDLILFEHKHLAQTTIQLLHQLLDYREYRKSIGPYDTLCSRVNL